MVKKISLLALLGFITIFFALYREIWQLNSVLFFFGTLISQLIIISSLFKNKKILVLFITSILLLLNTVFLIKLNDYLLSNELISYAFWYAVIFYALQFYTLLSIITTTEIPSHYNFIKNILSSFLFGFLIFFLWQIIVTGAKVPHILLPSPLQILSTLIQSIDVLYKDFIQTIIKGVLPGYFIGCASGYLIALSIDRFLFLQRGLLPLGNFVSALPIVGAAPIMVMWFGFDWHSKAAIVIIVTFFPMLVNTITGLNSARKIEKELIRTYNASYLQTLLMVKLPRSFPFVFNALKINSTIAVISAIVAEFFGTPIVGLGFRISTEIGRINVEMVWAAIVVSAIASSSLYIVLSFIEKKFAFWHPTLLNSK